MWGIGFGLEKIGLVALRKPVFFSIILAVGILASLGHFLQLRFDGNVTAVLPKHSSAFVNYSAQKTDFRDFSRDIAVILKSPRLMSAEGLEEVRFLQLELAVTKGVGSVLSIFSLPKPDPETGALPPYLPDDLGDDANVKRLIEDLIKSQPQASSLISPKDNAALLFVTLDVGMQDAKDSELYRLFQELKKTTEENIPDDFEVHYSGLTPIGLTIIAALIDDQVRLTLVGLALGALIAFLVFRSAIAALICAIPPTLTAIWTLGMFAILQIPINYLTTVLPTLALILAYADAIMLYYRWHKSNANSADGSQANLLANLKDAVIRVGPASSLTSITTALAFLSFSYSSSEALKSFAYLGVGAVSLAFLSVIIGVPIAGYWLVRLGAVKGDKAKPPVFENLGAIIHAVFAGKSSLVFLSAIALVIGLTFVHLAIRPEYKVTDYLPHASKSREAEKIANEVFGGRSMIFLSVPVADKETLVGDRNRERLKAVEDILKREFQASSMVSLSLLWDEFGSEDARLKISESIKNAPDSSRRGYISSDGSAMLVSIRIPSDQSITKTLEQIADIKTALAEYDFGEGVRISGFPVLMAEEFSRLIEQLRTSLLIAIGLGILIIGFATRSPLMTLAAITPNLLPILGVELILYLRGGVINLSEVIALTVAFGIAIDNAVHVINVYEAEKRSGKAIPDAVRDALIEVGPALGSSTMIICVASTVTLMSTMPVVPILGQLIIATLFIALFANLAILPANILTLSRVSRMFATKRQENL